MASINQTASCSSFPEDPLCFQSTPYPFYFTRNPSLLGCISDHTLTLAAPVICYWVLSLFFHYLDMSGWKWLDKYRLHESAEVKSRNLVTRTQVVAAVILQQVIQTALAAFWISADESQTVNHAPELRRIAFTMQPVFQVLGEHQAEALLPHMAYFVYWWGIPTFQFFAAMFIIDTWQYFLHRAMHVNKFLYKQFHSWHHRLYVPYAFGSLYNHPVEGFVLDSLGAAIAEWATGMTTRQAMLLFSFSTLKTVDDHCGYNLPFDPLQLITGNNADYHDIHHQVIGIKSNFAQPFFVHWDALLGTRMTREDIARRRQKHGKAS